MAVAVIAQLRLSRALRTLQTEQLRTDSVDSLRQLCGMLVKIASIPGPLRASLMFGEGRSTTFE